MNEYELKEAFDFELELAKILLKDDPWKYKFKVMKFTKAKHNSVYRNGTIQLSITKYDEATKFKELRDDIRCLFADLHSGFAKRDKFLWQHAAENLGVIDEIDAIDLSKCELCGKLTPLTRTKRCLKCKKIEEAVLSDPERARKILATFDVARKVLHNLGDNYG